MPHTKSVNVETQSSEMTRRKVKVFAFNGHSYPRLLSKALLSMPSALPVHY